MGKQRNVLMVFRFKTDLEDGEIQAFGEEVAGEIKEHHSFPEEEFEFLDCKEEEGEPLKDAQ